MADTAMVIKPSKTNQAYAFYQFPGNFKFPGNCILRFFSRDAHR
jgi:hypothetical protein